MKHPAFLFSSILAVLIVLFVFPVCADEINPTITHVFFEKDGMPYNESVHFTVNCYGYACRGWDCRAPEDLLARSGNYSQEVIFSFHASCPEYGCTIHEPYYHVGRKYIDSCSVEGVTGSGNFTLQNFSRTPTPHCTDLMPYEIGMGVGKYYNGTPDYLECLDETRTSAEMCNNFAVTCDPSTDHDCGYWVINGTNMKETEKSRSCREHSAMRQEACNIYLKEVDPATMDMWKDPDSDHTEPARRTCELRFTVPSDNRTAVTAGAITQKPVDGPLDHPGANFTFGPRVSATSRGMSPVESLYCSLLSIFGARC